MITCDICGANFKTAQGLAGHKRLRHSDKLTSELGVALTGKQLYRKMLGSLGEKLADRLAEAILEISNGGERVQEKVTRGLEVIKRYSWDEYAAVVLQRLKHAAQVGTT